VRLPDRFKREAPPWAILFGGWLVFWIYASPGFMTWDSVNQLLQARGATMSDWHPPVMAYTWRFLELLVRGPAPMLLLQSATFLVGAFVLLRRTIRPWIAAIAAACVFLFPPVVAPMAVIWKDSQMAGFLLAGLAAITAADRRWRVAGAVLLLLATTERYNAPAATLPLVVGLFVWRDDLVPLKRYALAAGMWLAITMLAFGANAALVEEHGYLWHKAVAPFDIAGSLLRSPDLDDAAILEAMPGVPFLKTTKIRGSIRHAYHPEDWASVMTGPTAIFATPETAEQRAAFSHAWRWVVLHEPIAYARHRFRVFWAVLGMHDYGQIWTFFTAEPLQANLIDYHPKAGWIQRRLIARMRKLDRSVLFKPLPYFVAAFILLAIARRRRLPFIMLASGITYELSLLVAAASADFRYSHWMISMTLFAAVLLFAERYADGRGERPRGAGA
jgi:hypothetical protein